MGDVEAQTGEQWLDDLARRLLDALHGQDKEGFVACFHPEAELMWPRNLLEGGSYRGHDGLREAFDDAFDLWKSIRVEPEEIRLAAEDRGVILCRVTNVPDGDGPTVSYEMANVISLRNRKISYFRPYLSHAEGLEAVGLQDPARSATPRRP